jgi:hypothetical protein
MSKATEVFLIILVVACTIGRLVYQSRSVHLRSKTK